MKEVKLLVMPLYYSAAGKTCRKVLVDGVESGLEKMTVCQDEQGEWFRAPMIYSQPGGKW